MYTHSILQERGLRKMNAFNSKKRLKKKVYIIIAERE
jgi:hypothetical protein